MTETHTPGPWVVQSMSGESRLIANGECIMCDTAYYPWTPHNDADWHLIAAAPDLLDALKGLRMWMPPCGTDPEIDDAMNAADDAIAKAEGKA